MTTATNSDISKPRYFAVKPSPDGAKDNRGRELYCQNHPETRAVWTGVRRPPARIMRYPFAFCGECWKGRME